MINKKFLCGSICLAFCALAHAGALGPVKTSAPYIGVIGGYGSTTWDGLVPSVGKQNEAMNMSTPISVEEGGAVWGLFAGYEFSSYFAVEANYMKYPNARVTFAPGSLFAFDHDEVNEFSSSTDLLSLMGKIMLIIPQTNFRAYSSFGVADLHRKDMVLEDWRVSPSFGVGLIYPLSEHFMASLSGDYTAGFGESQLSPADSYFPFLYSVTARLAYRF